MQNRKLLAGILEISLLIVGKRKVQQDRILIFGRS